MQRLPFTSEKDTVTKDIFLCHTGADKPWVENLASRIEAESYEGRRLSVVYDKWDFRRGLNIVLELENDIDASRFIGIVVTKALLAAEWPTLERSIAVWSDPSGSRGRVIPLLRENVTLPPSLRIRNWIDFRDDDRFEDAFAELIRVLRGEQIPRGRGSLMPMVPERKLPYEPAPVILTSSLGPDKINERIISNLYPVLELPEFVYGMDTKLRTKAEIQKFEESKHIPGFILREGRLFTFSPLFGDSVRKKRSRRSRETLKDWFADQDHRRWAIELLNLSFKQHAWERHLRFDSTKARFFFSPLRNGPKQIRWIIGRRLSAREVTTPHNIRKLDEAGNRTEIQYGWRHQGIRANFVLLPAGLFLRLEPIYLLTKPNGKTPRGGSRVGPILSHWINQERNGQILRSLRFWSLVLAHRQNEIVLATGQQPIRVGLVSDSGHLGFGIAADQIDYDRLMRAELEDDVAVPQLGLFSEENEIPDETDFESEDE